MRRILVIGVCVVAWSIAIASSGSGDRGSGSPTLATTSPTHSAVTLERAPLFVPLQVEASLEPIRADVWQSAGFTGYGQKVAIIDAGFEGYRDALGVSLPETVVARSFRRDRDPGAGTDHGVSAAEIVHAVAPSAQLYLVNFETEAELSQAVDFLIAEQVDVVSFSLGFIHAGPGDGTGLVDGIVGRAVDAGVIWSVASGNWAQQHWGGQFTDVDGDSIHEFAPAQELDGRRFLAGDLVIASLRWQGVWGAACDDYDLELFGPDGALVAASRDIQNCSGDPVESLQVLATKTGMYSARVVEADATTSRRISLLVLGSPDRGDTLAIAVAAGSLSQPADHPGVLSVGAILGGTGLEAPFSSRGPTSDGRFKPEVLAPTGRVNGAGETFTGTSASAPHVAGMLALLGEAFPSLDSKGLITELRKRTQSVAGSSRGSATLGTLVRLGELLPVGADEAQLAGELPPRGGLAVLRYGGPDGYPLRFAHLLTGLVDAEAFYRLDASTQRWEVYIRGAPAFVQDFDRFDDGDLVVALFGRSS